MEQNTNKNRALGFYSADGHFQQMGAITSRNLEYVSRSRMELEDMLQENITLECYEKCALIRDELAKRAN